MVAQTPLVTLDPRTDKAWSDAYREGWRALNRAMRRGDPWSGNERNVAYLQLNGVDERVAFADVGPLIGLDGIGDGRSAARLDVDFDGDDDLVLSNRTAPRLQVLQNRVADGIDQLAVRVEGTACNREGIGAIVLVAPEASVSDEPGQLLRSGVQRRTRTAGAGYLAQSSEWLRFAFGPDGDDRRARKVHVHVKWPDAQGEEGAFEDFGLLRVGRSFVLKQGAGAARRFDAPEPVELAEDPIEFLGGAQERVRIILPRPVSTPGLSVRSKSGKTGILFGRTPRGPRGSGRPAVVVAWDSSSIEQLEALGDLKGVSIRAKERGIDVLALDIGGDAASLENAARALAAQGWVGDVLSGTGETRTVLREVVGWRLDQTDPAPFPWSYVFGPEGRLHVLRQGPWQVADLEQDLDLVAMDARQRLAAASPVSGRWLVAPTEANLARLQRRLERSGATAAVRELELSQVSTEVSKLDLAMRIGRSAMAQGDLNRAIASFERAVLADAESVDAVRALAYALHAAMRFEDAQEAWTRALALDSDHVGTIASRAVSAALAGDRATALADLDALRERGDEATAERRAVEQALAREPDKDASGRSSGGGR